jgi:hypothetical protein
VLELSGSRRARRHLVFSGETRSLLDRPMNDPNVED